MQVWNLVNQAPFSVSLDPFSLKWSNSPRNTKIALVQVETPHFPHEQFSPEG